MSRIPTPARIADALEKVRGALEAVRKQPGTVPNMFRTMATSPQTLEGTLGQSGALARRAGVHVASGRTINAAGVHKPCMSERFQRLRRSIATLAVAQARSGGLS